MTARTGPRVASAEVELSPISVDDAGEVLTIQRAAFVSEALIYGSVDMPPLTQTLDELEAELRESDGWVARVDGRLVGAIRSREADGLLLIGRIAIAPDMQGSGIGRALLDAAERPQRRRRGRAVHRQSERGEHPPVRELRLRRDRARGQGRRRAGGLPAQAPAAAAERT